MRAWSRVNTDAREHFQEVFDQIQRQKYSRMLEHENSEARGDDQHDGEISSAVSTDASEATHGTAITDYIGLAKVDRLLPEL